MSSRARQSQLWQEHLDAGGPLRVTPVVPSRVLPAGALPDAGHDPLVHTLRCISGRQQIQSPPVGRRRCANGGRRGAAGQGAPP